MFRLKGREKLSSMEGGYKTMEAYRDELMGFVTCCGRWLTPPTARRSQHWSRHVPAAAFTPPRRQTSLSM